MVKPQQKVELFSEFFSVVMIFLKSINLPMRSNYCIDSLLSGCRMASQCNLTAWPWMKVRIVSI